MIEQFLPILALSSVKRSVHFGYRVIRRPIAIENLWSHFFGIWNSEM